MSFFLEGKRNTDFPVTTNPSPFQYNPHRQQNRTKSYAPFGSTSKLERGMKAKPKKQQKEQIKDIIDDDRVFVIEDKTVQTFSHDKMNSMFKSKSQRFSNPIKNNPGPGSYELRSKYKTMNKNRSEKSLQMSMLAASRKINPPSIPTDNLGYKCDRYNNIEKVEPKSANPPAPGSYDVQKGIYKQNGPTWSTLQTISRKEDEPAAPGPGHYNMKAQTEKATTSCFKSAIDRFNPRKIKRSYQPGPGDYNPNEQVPLRQFSQTHFNSKTTRFMPKRSENLGPGSYNPERSKSLKQFKPVKNLSESQTQVQPARKTIFNQNSKNPGPGEYILREGMTFQLQKALLRKHNLSQFPNQRRDVFEARQYDEPGPGAYDPQKPQQTEKGNLGYKKAEVVNLKADEVIQSPSPFDYHNMNNTIEKKVEDNSKRITLTDAKPFNSGAERFSHYNLQPQKNNEKYGTYETDTQSIDTDQNAKTMKFSELKKTKKLVMTSVKVKVPFGTSASKHHDQEYAEVGPGYYDSGNAWLKASHSIKARIGNQQG